jgi:hypothetical protein
MTTPPRPVLVTIDGDGFIYRSRELGRPVGEVLLEEILTVYPFKFTASVIAGELERSATGFDADLAARIFALDNVQAASHSWSHPNDWRSGRVDLGLEIRRSVGVIESRLLGEGKRVEAFLWTGRCNPTPQALRAVTELGIANLNGGPKRKPFRRVGGFRQYSSRAPNDWDLMELERLVMRAGGGSTSVARFLETYPGSLDGYRRVIGFFEKHPRLPIHVYFHWYSGVRRDSLDALKEVLSWCERQGGPSLWVSEYVARVEAGGLGPGERWRQRLTTLRRKLRR